MNDAIREAAGTRDLPISNYTVTSADGPRDISLLKGLARALCEQSGTARARLARVRADYGSLVSVAADCLRLRPQERPTADEVLRRMREDEYVREEVRRITVDYCRRKENKKIMKMIPVVFVGSNNERTVAVIGQETVV